MPHPEASPAPYWCRQGRDGAEAEAEAAMAGVIGSVLVSAGATGGRMRACAAAGTRDS